MAWWDAVTDFYKGVGNAVGNADWNPKRSSLFTGAGTPWGEGPRDPYQAQYKAFNPDEYAAMDTSKLGQALRQDIGQNAARSKARMSAALQARGGGGADAIGGLAALEAQQGQDENTLNAKLAQMDYENRYRQYQDYLRLEEAKAARDQNRYSQETGARGAIMAPIGSILGAGIGAIGGGVGSALGSQLGADLFGGGKKKKSTYDDF